MSDFGQVKFNLSRDLIRQHNILRRNFARAIEVLGSHKNVDLSGLKIFLREIIKDLDLHHVVEDKQLFPSFQAKGAIIDDFVQEHRTLEEILFRLRDDVNRISPDGLWTNRDRLASQLRQIQNLILPHFEEEEKRLGDEFISQHFSQKEADNLAWKVVIFAQLRSLPFPSVGYFFFSQTDREVNEMFNRFPAPVVWFLKHVLLPVAKIGYGSQIPFYHNFWLRSKPEN
jgi:hemerythrin-like domain-containing protein